MGALEQISQMKSQGMPEQEIISRLKQQGISPKNINDALSQSQIKNAVYNPQETEMQSPGQPPMPEATTGAPYSPQTQEMEPQQNPPQQESSAPQPQESYAPQPQEEYAPPQEVYQQESYGYPQEESGSDMMIDISEQVFNEKIKKIEKQIDKMNDTQVLLQTQTENAIGRLKRIELIMDKLQVAILERVGSYGKNLEIIKKEMGMIEDSFSKIVPGTKKTSHTTPHKVVHKQVHKTTKKKISKKK